MAREAAALVVNEPSMARVYNVLLGGKDNFTADRHAAQQLIDVLPTAELEAADNRRFILRAVRSLVRAAVRQFLDVGAGIPHWESVHEIVHEELRGHAEQGRVLYVDTDALAVVHSRALLPSTRRVTTGVLDGDLRKPDEILSSPELARTLDLSQPVGLLLGAVLPHCEDAVSAVRRLIEALPSGSYVVLSHVTADFLSPHFRARVATLQPCMTFRLRSRQEIAEYVVGLDLIEPGWVTTARWRPDVQPCSAIGGDHSNPLSYAVVAQVP